MISTLFEKGGVLMYPLLLFSVSSVAVIAEKTVVYFRTSIRRGTFDKITGFSGQENAGRPASYPGTIRKGNFSIEIIEKAATGKFKSEKEASIAISALMLKSVSRIHLLDLVGRISPMTGLTGTVIGLAKAFQTVSLSGRTADTAALAGGIWEAMITTIAGLLIAIPAIIAAHLLRSGFRKNFAMLRHCIDAVFAISHEASPEGCGITDE